MIFVFRTYVFGRLIHRNSPYQELFFSQNLKFTFVARTVAPIGFRRERDFFFFPGYIKGIGRRQTGSHTSIIPQSSILVVFSSQQFASHRLVYLRHGRYTF